MFILNFSRIEGTFALHKIIEGQAPQLLATGPSHIGSDPEPAQVPVSASNDHGLQKPQLSLV